MHKYVLIVIMMFLLSLVVACDGTNHQPNTVSSTKLTEREDYFLLTATEQSFVFDFNTDNSFKEVSVWIEKYESGSFVGEINRITSEIGKDGMLMFTTSKKLEDQNQSLFTVSINSNDGSATGWGPEKIPGEQAVWGSNPSDRIPIKGKMVLASISYADNQNEMKTYSSDFYIDVDLHKEELKQHKTVYLFRCEFIK